MSKVMKVGCCMRISTSAKRRVSAVIIAFLLITYVSPLSAAGESATDLELAPLYGTYDLFSPTTTTVIVEVESPSLIEAKHMGISQTEQYLASQRQKVIRRLQEVIPNVQVEMEYEYLFAGMAITLPANMIPQLLVTPGVRAVYPNVTYTVETGLDRGVIYQYDPEQMDSPSLRGIELIRDLWGFTGKDVKVAVLDTGVDYTHPDLKQAFGEYKGWDFVDNTADPQETPSGHLGGEPTTHGTHIAGIIAARGAMDGIAPQAELLSYRVVGPGGTGSTERILAALEQAFQDEADIINLSLAGDEPDWALGKALHWVQAEDRLVVASVEMEAPVDPDLLHADQVLEPLKVDVLPAKATQYVAEISLKDQLFLHDINVAGYSDGKDVNRLSQRQYAVEYVFDKALDEIPELKLNKKIAIMSDQQVPYIDYIQALHEAGAAAVIICQTDEKAVGDLVIPGTPLPTFVINYDQVLAVDKAIKAGLDKLSINLQLLSPNADRPSGNDERQRDMDRTGKRAEGRAAQQEADLAAPGERVLSTVTTHNAKTPHGYAVSHGAQYSTAHVAGALALLLEAQQELGEPLSAEEWKTLLKATADTELAEASHPWSDGSRPADRSARRGEQANPGVLNLWHALLMLQDESEREEQLSRAGEEPAAREPKQDDGMLADRSSFTVRNKGPHQLELRLNLDQKADFVQFWVYSADHQFMGTIGTFVDVEDLKTVLWDGQIDRKPLENGQYYLVAYVEHDQESTFLNGGTFSYHPDQFVALGY